jgi:hypothetical protein
MADNVIVPDVATGPSIATDEIGGAQYQRVKLIFGDEGVNEGDVSSANPFPVALPSVATETPLPVSVYGEAVEALEAMRIAVQALTRTIGQMQPDTAARMRVAIDAISGGLTLATITTVGTVTTVATLTNQTQIGGLAATEQIPSLMRLGADSMRRNITVS